MQKKTLFITYCNYKPKLKKIFSKKFNKKLNNTLIWNPQIIKKNYKDLNWVTKDYTKKFNHKSQEIKSSSKIDRSSVMFKGWLKNGCQSWKPQIIYLSLKKFCKPNDILVYHDINYIKYPLYLKNFNINKSFYSKITKNHSIVLFRDAYQPLGVQCKNILLKKFNLRKYKAMNGFWSGLIVIKNDSAGRSFIKKWCEISTIDNLGPLPDTKKKNKDFVINAVDQSTLSILYYKEKKIREKIKIVYAPFRQIFKFNFFYLRNIKAFLIIKYLELISIWQQ